MAAMGEPRTDLHIAKLIAAGILPSPSIFHNSVLFKIRVSGTGVSFRPKHNEFVYRDPAIWLSPEICQRVRGVPLVENHPTKNVLDGETFYSSIVGLLIHGFAENDELKAIARIFEKRAAAILEAGSYDTSPAVIDPQGIIVKVGNEQLLIEGEPAVIDHVALIDTSDGNQGVWNKTGADLGVEISEGAISNA